MNLSRHDPETEMDMNMTPMIDVVFLLIIFFMIITDLTQKELEELVLPVAAFAVPDKPDPDKWRPILNIQYDGKIIIMRILLYDPEVDDNRAKPYERVLEWLAQAAKRMEKAPIDDNDPSSMKIPDEALLIRADQSTPFKHIQKVMEMCGKTGIQIWKIQLAVSVPEGDKDKE